MCKKNARMCNEKQSDLGTESSHSSSYAIRTSDMVVVGLSEVNKKKGATSNKQSQTSRDLNSLKNCGVSLMITPALRMSLIWTCRWRYRRFVTRQPQVRSAVAIFILGGGAGLCNLLWKRLGTLCRCTLEFFFSAMVASCETKQTL